MGSRACRTDFRATAKNASLHIFPIAISYSPFPFYIWNICYSLLNCSSVMTFHTSISRKVAHWPKQLASGSTNMVQHFASWQETPLMFSFRNNRNSFLVSNFWTRQIKAQWKTDYWPAKTLMGYIQSVFQWLFYELNRIGRLFILNRINYLLCSVFFC